MTFAWETTARYVFKGCYKMNLRIPMSQSVDMAAALKASYCHKSKEIIIEGIWIPIPYPEIGKFQPQKRYEALAVPDAPCPLLTSHPYPSESEKRVLS